MLPGPLPMIGLSPWCLPATGVLLSLRNPEPWTVWEWSHQKCPNAHHEPRALPAASVTFYTHLKNKNPYFKKSMMKKCNPAMSSVLVSIKTEFCSAPVLPPCIALHRLLLSILASWVQWGVSGWTGGKNTLEAHQILFSGLLRCLLIAPSWNIIDLTSMLPISHKSVH